MARPHFRRPRPSFFGARQAGIRALFGAFFATILNSFGQTFWALFGRQLGDFFVVTWVTFWSPAGAVFGRQLGDFLVVSRRTFWSSAGALFGRQLGDFLVLTFDFFLRQFWCFFVTHFLPFCIEFQ